jgi:hypothetical protein
VGEAGADGGAVVGGEEIGVGVWVVEVGLQAVRRSIMRRNTGKKGERKLGESESFGCMK